MDLSLAVKRNEARKEGAAKASSQVREALVARGLLDADPSVRKSALAAIKNCAARGDPAWTEVRTCSASATLSFVFQLAV